MSIKKEKTAELVKEYSVSKQDNGGSVEAQVAILTENIHNLTDHMKRNPKDNHSNRGLLKMVNRRKKLLTYIKGKSQTAYENLIKKLGIRK